MPTLGLGAPRVRCLSIQDGRRLLRVLDQLRHHSLQRINDASVLKEERNTSRRSSANFDTLGSWNNRIDMPLNLEQSIKHGKLIPQISTRHAGFATLVGRRRENEDRFKVTMLGNRVMMMSVFDGHGGSLAADYTCDHMEEHVRFWLERGEKDLGKVLQRSFLEVNNSFARCLYRNYIGQEHALGSGTTATVCLLRNSIELVVSHVGDSRALLCRDGKVVRLTNDHEPDNEVEKARIKKAGGLVTWSSHGKPRVNGRLDMSRSIGDVELKSAGVIAEPDIKSIEVKHHKDAFVILMTDGVSYVLNDLEVVGLVSQCHNPREAACFVTDQALHFGSEDNATAVVVPFGAWGKYSGQSDASMQYSFGRNISGKRYL